MNGSDMMFRKNLIYITFFEPEEKKFSFSTVIVYEQ